MSKADEFKQFDTESLVRRVVSGILDPHLERSNNNANELKDMRRQIEVMHGKVEDLDRVIKRDMNLKAFLEDIKKRQLQIVSSPA